MMLQVDLAFQIPETNELNFELEVSMERSCLDVFKLEKLGKTHIINF